VLDGFLPLSSHLSLSSFLSSFLPSFLAVLGFELRVLCQVLYHLSTPSPFFDLAYFFQIEFFVQHWPKTKFLLPMSPM
jgi:hypothetical protein